MPTRAFPRRLGTEGIAPGESPPWPAGVAADSQVPGWSGWTPALYEVRAAAKRLAGSVRGPVGPRRRPGHAAGYHRRAPRHIVAGAAREDPGSRREVAARRA